MASLVLNPDYDREADVLYLTIGDPSGPSECEDRRDGITVRYSAFDMKPVGVIVVGYDQYGWPSRASRLAKIVGEILAIPSGDVRRALPS